MQPYHGPHPPPPTPDDPCHIYGQFVFKQPEKSIKFAPMDPSQRHNWDYIAFIKQYGLGEKLASNKLHCSG